MAQWFFRILTLLLLSQEAFSQTNPAPQALPFSFSSQTGSTLPAGFAVHKFTSIPTTRSLLPCTGDLPYTASSTSGGWKDETNNGISILASSTQQAGAWVISVNTTGLTNIQVQWTVRLMLQQASRDNSVALQYRTGTTGNFTDIGTTSTYSSTGQVAGHFLTFTELLPAAAENQPVVQLRWIYWESAGSAGSRDRLAIDDITIGQASAPCTEPANQPNTLNLVPSLNAVSGSFTAPAPPATGYLVIRSQSATLSVNPADGTSYTPGQAIGNGTVVSSDASASFTDNGLLSGTLYYYYVFAYNNNSCTGGPNYLILNPLSGSTTTLSLPPCTTPAAPPTGLILTPGGTFMPGSFTPEPSANTYLVVYSRNNSLGFTPTNGTRYTQGQVIGQDVIVSFGGATSFIVSGLSNLTTYYVFVFSASDTCNGQPYYNTTSLNGSATTTNGLEPPGYYNAANGLTCQNLKTALRDIIANGQTALSYGTLDDTQMPIVDTTRKDDGSGAMIWDIYSNNPTGPEPFMFNTSQNPGGGFCGGTTPGTEGGCWNKEHTFPKSWFKLAGSAYQQPTEADLFVVRPTDSKINGNRANLPYSTVGPTTSYQFPLPGAFAGYPMPPNPVLVKIGPSNYPGVTASAAFEPYDGVKGDIARAYFYILTRYQNELPNWVSLNSAAGITTVVDGTTNSGLYPSFQIPYLTMLYNWNLLDPVDAREINWNDLIYSQQNNRNPYIDHPEYIAMVWQCTGALPVTIISFTAQKNNAAVLLKWYATYETSFKEYEVQRSVDGIVFSTIGTVAGRNLANYDFTDHELPLSNTVYYRLKMKDVDGKFSYSKTVAVRIHDDLPGVQVYPNPTGGKCAMKLPVLGQSSLLKITDITGRVVYRQTIAASDQNVAMDLSTLAPGRYFMQICNDHTLVNQSIVVLR